MAERRAILGRAPERPGSKKLQEDAESVASTDEAPRRRQASFVYRNMPQDSRIARESAIASVGRMRIG